MSVPTIMGRCQVCEIFFGFFGTQRYPAATVSMKADEKVFTKGQLGRAAEKTTI